MSQHSHEPARSPASPAPAGISPTTHGASPSSPSNLLASCRTGLATRRNHLAVFRTTVSLIGFGISINKFANFMVRDQQAAVGDVVLLKDASRAGIVLVLAGFILAGWTLLREAHARAGAGGNHHDSIVTTAVLFALAGAAVVWLALDR